MTKSEYALDYSSCSVTQLRAFIKSRTEKPAPARRAKSYYVKTLRRLDKDSTFRFLDLAPELRNLVYRELLTWPDTAEAGKRFCWPRILGTSKQINEEAKDIIYAENVARLDLSVEYTWLGTREFMGYTMVFGNAQKLTHGSGPSCMDDLRFECPAFLRKIHHIVVSVAIYGEESVHAFGPKDTSRLINHLLYAMSSSLAKSNNLKTVTLEFRGDAPANKVVDEASMADMLWPLSKLELPSSSIHLRGFDEGASDQRRAQGDAALSGPQPAKYNLWNDFELLENQVEQYRKLLYKLEEPSVANGAMRYFTNREDDFVELMDSPAFMTQAREDEMRDYIHTSRKRLHEKGLAELEEAVDAESRRTKAAIQDLRQTMDASGTESLAE